MKDKKLNFKPGGIVSGKPFIEEEFWIDAAKNVKIPVDLLIKKDEEIHRKKHSKK